MGQVFFLALFSYSFFFFIFFSYLIFIFFSYLLVFFDRPTNNQPKQHANIIRVLQSWCHKSQRHICDSKWQVICGCYWRSATLLMTYQIVNIVRLVYEAFFPLRSRFYCFFIYFFFSKFSPLLYASIHHASFLSSLSFTLSDGAGVSPLPSRQNIQFAPHS